MRFSDVSLTRPVDAATLSREPKDVVDALLDGTDIEVARGGTFVCRSENNCFLGSLGRMIRDWRVASLAVLDDQTSALVEDDPSWGLAVLAPDRVASAISAIDGLVARAAADPAALIPYFNHDNDAAEIAAAVVGTGPAYAEGVGPGYLFARLADLRRLFEQACTAGMGIGHARYVA